MMQWAKDGRPIEYKRMVTIINLDDLISTLAIAMSNSVGGYIILALMIEQNL